MSEEIRIRISTETLQKRIEPFTNLINLYDRLGTLVYLNEKSIKNAAISVFAGAQSLGNIDKISIYLGYMVGENFREDISLKKRIVETKYGMITGGGIRDLIRLLNLMPPVEIMLNIINIVMGVQRNMLIRFWKDPKVKNCLLYTSPSPRDRG